MSGPQRATRSKAAKGLENANNLLVDDLVPVEDPLAQTSKPRRGANKRGRRPGGPGNTARDSKGDTSLDPFVDSSTAIAISRGAPAGRGKRTRGARGILVRGGLSREQETHINEPDPATSMDEGAEATSVQADVALNAEPSHQPMDLDPPAQSPSPTIPNPVDPSVLPMASNSIDPLHQNPLDTAVLSSLGAPPASSTVPDLPARSPSATISTHIAPGSSVSVEALVLSSSIGQPHDNKGKGQVPQSASQLDDKDAEGVLSPAETMDNSKALIVRPRTPIYGDDTAMELIPAQHDETSIKPRLKPTKEDFENLRGQALQLFGSADSIGDIFDWTDYQQSWSVRKGAPKKEVKQRFELFGQLITLATNALAAEAGVGQASAWEWMGITRKESRGPNDYNTWSHIRGPQIKNERPAEAAADRTYVSKALGAEWYTMTTKQKVAAATEAEMVAENEDGDMVKEALATPLKREKYVKGHLDNLSTIAARETARSGIETVGIAMLPEVAGSFASITHSFGSSQSVLAAWERFMPHVNELEKALQGKSELKTVNLAKKPKDPPKWPDYEPKLAPCDSKNRDNYRSRVTTHLRAAQQLTSPWAHHVKVKWAECLTLCFLQKFVLIGWAFPPAFPGGTNENGLALTAKHLHPPELTILCNKLNEDVNPKRTATDLKMRFISIKELWVTKDGYITTEAPDTEKEISEVGEVIVFVRQVPEAASLRLRIESAEVLEDTERESEDERDDESSDGAGSGDGNDKKKGKPKPEKKKEKKEEKKEKKAVSAVRVLRAAEGRGIVFEPPLDDEVVKSEAVKPEGVKSRVKAEPESSRKRRNRSPNGGTRKKSKVPIVYEEISDD